MLTAPAVEVSRRPNPFQRVAQVWRYRELLGNLVRKELKVKYKNSVLGFLWTLLNPMLYLVVFSVVFQEVLQVEIPYFAIFFLSGLLAWNFFATTLVGGHRLDRRQRPAGAEGVVPARDPARSPSMGAAMVHFVLQMIVLAGAMAVFQRSPNLEYFPALGAGHRRAADPERGAWPSRCGAINVYLRDTEHLLELVLLAWFWMSAIVYPYQLVADRLGPGTGVVGVAQPDDPDHRHVPEGALQPVRAVPLVHQLGGRSDRRTRPWALTGCSTPPCPSASCRPTSPTSRRPRSRWTTTWAGTSPTSPGSAPFSLVAAARRAVALRPARGQPGRGDLIRWRTRPSRSIDVTKIFKLYREKAKSAKERVIRAGRNPYTPFYALRDISLEVAEGETLALLGHNGSGKSTLLKCVAGTLRPTTGRITTRGRLAALLELGAGFHPDLTGRENVFLNGSILGFSKAPGRAHLRRHRRVLRAVGVHRHPGEALLVGHVRPARASRWRSTSSPTCCWSTRCCRSATRRSSASASTGCGAFQREGRTILLVTHATDTVRQIAHRAAVLDHGRMVEVGEVGDAIRTFRETLNRDHEVHGEVEAAHAPRSTPVTGELPVVVAPVELVPDAGAEVTISSVDIEYPDPSLDALLPGRPLTIRIGYHATGMITDVVFAIEIFDDDGTRLLGTTTDVLEQPIHAVAGDGQVLFRFEQVPLLDGTFHLTLMIHTRDGGTIYDQRDYEDSFQVTNPTRSPRPRQLPHQDRAPVSLLNELDDRRCSRFAIALARSRANFALAGSA